MATPSTTKAKSTKGPTVRHNEGCPEDRVETYQRTTRKGKGSRLCRIPVSRCQDCGQTGYGKPDYLED